MIHSPYSLTVSLPNYYYLIAREIILLGDELQNIDTIESYLAGFFSQKRRKKFDEKRIEK